MNRCLKLFEEGKLEQAIVHLFNQTEYFGPATESTKNFQNKNVKLNRVSDHMTTVRANVQADHYS